MEVMKKNLFLIVLVSVVFSGGLFAQSKALLKAADKSFDAAEKSYKRYYFDEAAESYEIVMNNIPISVDSRKYLVMRIESNIKLIDIYFNHSENLQKACVYVDRYYKDMNSIKNSPYLKSKDIFRYLELQKDFEKYQRKCHNFRGIDSDKKEFENKFDEEFKDEE